MSRDSIHVTMTAQLRQAQVRQRLEALAINTALPTAHLAGRALAIGLGYIEHDYRLIFPAASTTELLTTPALADTQHTAAAAASEQLTTPAPTDTQHTAAAAAATAATAQLTTSAPTDTQHTAAAADSEQLTTPAPAEAALTSAAQIAEQATAPSSMMLAEPTPPAAHPLRIPSQAAARALKKTLPAFHAHLHRHPELKRHSEMVGRSAMWDLAGLRADWTK